MSPEDTPRLLVALERAALAAPLERKLLVGRSVGEGRELLRGLARRGVAWVGFEVTTPRPLALTVAGPALARDEVQLLDEFAERALVDASLDAVLQGGGYPELAALAEGVGFRDAVADAVRALRLAGVAPDRVRGGGLEDRHKAGAIAGVLERYEARLDEGGAADTAGLLARATGLLESGGARLPEGRLLLLPGLRLRGVTGRFVAALRSRGAQVLETDPVLGLEAPRAFLWAQGEPACAFSELFAVSERRSAEAPSTRDAPAGGPAPPGSAGAANATREPHRDPYRVLPELGIFAAAGVQDELREALRRVMAEGRRWDEVEIVTPDPVTYGSALHALAGRLGIPVSFGVGLPVERTRPGRVAATYLRWIRSGFPADVIRTLLEAGDLRAPRSAGAASGSLPPSPIDLARRLRGLRVGWGRDRYIPAIDRALRAVERPPVRAHPEDDEARQARRLRVRAELHALRGLLAPVLEATPAMPDRLGRGGEPVSPADLAAGLLAILRQVRSGSAPDATALRKLRAILERIRMTLQRRTSFAAAAAIVEERLRIRVPAPEVRGSAPWVSSGGRLHLTDVEHGGLSGRPLTFVLGLDADRVPGSDFEGPLLLDRDRRALAPRDLPSSADRLAESRFGLAALLARLRGKVVLGHRAWDMVEARAVAPSAFLLQALRLLRGDPRLTFRDLHEHVGRVAGAIPGGTGLLDEADVWMAALDRGGILLRGEAVVRGAYPSLDAGLRAAEALESDLAGPAHGILRPRPELDPRGPSGWVLSASRLEALGTCPRRYLYGTVLRLRPPDDPELDPERWLDALQRGSLLHGVFERTLREARAAGVAYDEAAFLSLALRILEEDAREKELEVPSPGPTVREREVEALRSDVRSFVQMVRDRGAPWEDLELRFGFDGKDPVELDLPGGVLRLRGAIDRVDRLPEGLRVVDYKTGRAKRFSKTSGVWHGGRRLQHAVYAAVAERLTGEPVARMEYHFPTPRGENHVEPFRREELRSGPALLDRLLQGVAEGRFPATDDAGDCRFCDFRAVCRVRDRGRSGVASPAADWTAARLEREEALAILRDARRWDRP